MKAPLRVLAIGFLVGSGLFALPARAQDDLTVKGEIVDLSCYLAHNLKGRSHKTCAEQCAKRGLPIGVVDENGDAYLLMEDHNNAEPYDQAKGLAGTQAEVKGKKFSKGGINGLLVGEVKGQ